MEFCQRYEDCLVFDQYFLVLEFDVICFLEDVSGLGGIIC